MENCCIYHENDDKNVRNRKRDNWGKIYMKIDFFVCKEIEKELYGENKEEC